MPIKYDDKEWEFADLVEHIKKTKPDVQSPGGYVKNIEKKQTGEMEGNLGSPHSGDTDNLQSSVGENDDEVEIKVDSKKIEIEDEPEKEIEYEGETYRLAPEGYEGTDNDLDLDGKIYTKEELDQLAPTMQPIDAVAENEEQEEADEEGGLSVAGPPVDSTIPANYQEYKKTGEAYVSENGKLIKVPVYETYKNPEFGKAFSLKNKKKDEKIGEVRANEATGNCDFCMGTGKVIVEKMGLKDCPRCDGEGSIQQDPMAMGGDPAQQDPAAQGGFGQEVPTNPIEGGDPTQQPDPTQDPNQIAQQQNPTEEIPQEEPEKKPNPFEKKTNKKKNPFTQENYRKAIGEACATCPNDLKTYTDYISEQLKVIKTQATGNETVGFMFGNEIEKKGKKIQGTLAYAGFSLNDRIYAPEELAKGDGMTVPLIINHASTIGAEKEIAEGRLPDEVVQALQRGEDYVVGEVTLDWNPETLTLSYTGIIEDEFWIKEVDDAEMAVSLGIYYDADSPRLCNDKCYTVIQGAEFREVSLVYHPGFPIATIEAVETYLKKSAVEYGNADLFKRKERAEEMVKKSGWNDDHGSITGINGNITVTGFEGFTVGDSTGDTQTFTWSNEDNGGSWISFNGATTLTSTESNNMIQPGWSLPKSTEEGLPDVEEPKEERPEDTDLFKKKDNATEIEPHDFLAEGPTGDDAQECQVCGGPKSEHN